VQAVIASGVISLASVVIPKLGGVWDELPKYSWFVGCAAGFALYYLLAKAAGVSAYNGKEPHGVETDASGVPVAAEAAVTLPEPA